MTHAVEEPATHLLPSSLCMAYHVISFKVVNIVDEVEEIIYLCTAYFNSKGPFMLRLICRVTMCCNAVPQ